MRCALNTKSALLDLTLLNAGKPLATCRNKNLSRMVFKKQATVDYEKRDRHGRIVGKVLLEGNDTCIRQIEDWRTLP